MRLVLVGFFSGRLAKLYHLLPIPTGWEVRHKDLDTKDYVHNKKNFFPVPPCFLYLHGIAQSFKNKAAGRLQGEEQEQPTQKLPWHVHKDKDGNVHQTNLLTFMEKLDSGHKVFNEYMGKSAATNDWQRFMKAETAVKRLSDMSKHMSAHHDEKPKIPNIFQPASTNFAPARASGAYQFIRSMKKTGFDWSRGRAVVDSQIATSTETTYYNSETDKRGYTFKVNPRVRVSTSSVAKQTLWSVASESRLAKTQSSFGKQINSQGILRFRIDKTPIVLRETRDSKGFYVNRLPERDLNEQRDEEDVFAKWEAHGGGNMDKEVNEEDENEDEKLDVNKSYDELNAMTEDVPAHLTQSQFQTTQHHFKTTQNYYKNYQRPEETQPFEPRIQNLTNEGLKRAMIRTSSSKFFNALNKDTSEYQSRKIRDAHSTTNFAEKKGQMKNIPPNLTRYNRLLLKSSEETKNGLLVKRATRDSAREYEELSHAKARLASSVKHQSMDSLRRALLTPDTSFYRDITALPIPDNGSRLLAYSEPVTQKAPKKKVTKDKPKK
jgi:hypothetical protein